MYIFLIGLFTLYLQINSLMPSFCLSSRFDPRYDDMNQEADFSTEADYEGYEQHAQTGETFYQHCLLLPCNHANKKKLILVEP